MEMFSNPGYLLGYIGSNVFATILLIIAIRKTKLARLLFFILFAWAFGMNYYVSHNQPEKYLEYAAAAVPLYRDFINGWFKDHITEMVTMIATGQLMIAFGMLLNGWLVKFACIGAIIFLMAIAPLGLYAGFPFSIIASIAAILILKKDNLNFIWRYRSLKIVLIDKAEGTLIK